MTKITISDQIDGTLTHPDGTIQHIGDITYAERDDGARAMIRGHGPDKRAEVLAKLDALDDG